MKVSTEEFFRKSNKTKLPNPHSMDEMLYVHTKYINYSNIQIKSSHFFKIFPVALFFGLPYFPLAISEKVNHLSLDIKLWCFSLCIVKIFFATLFLCTGVIYIPHKITIFTFYTLGCMSIVLTLYVVRKRKKITFTIRRLCEVSNAISPKHTTGSKYCLLQIICFALVFVYSTFIFFKSIYALEYTAKFKALGIDFLDVYRISITFTYLNAVAISGVLIIICNNIFVSLRNVINVYKKRLKGRYWSGNFCRLNILEDISLFRRIFAIYEQLEVSISPMLLSINVICIVSFLNSLSVLLTRKLTISALIGVLGSFGQTILGFVFLIFSAARVNKEYESLQQCLVHCSEGVAVTSSADVPLFSVLADNIRSTKFHFSAGDMYIIDKGLLITVGGAMVTYGVIEYQLAHTV